VPVPIWQFSVVWYYEFLNQCTIAALCDTVSACANVPLLCCVMLSVPVTKFIALLCDTVNVSTSVSLLCCVIPKIFPKR